MRIYSDIGVQVADVLLPRKGIDLRKWATIACDQFTSQPEYWEQVAKEVGNAPSTLNLILPEVYLGKPEELERIQTAQKTMRQYLDDGIFDVHSGLIHVERTVNSKTRHGLILALDLEKYDYSPGSQTLIRATEGTIVERIPPRMRIREGAAIELPHILVLIDDPQQTVIEPLAQRSDALIPLYDFELMQGSGHLKGALVADLEVEKQVIQALQHLASPEVFYPKYGVGPEKGVLLFAVGDGNHSLATAKACWEKLKPCVGMYHPARYALVEIENLHDPGLVFEPIHRVLFAVKQSPHNAIRRFFGEDAVTLTDYHDAHAMERAVKEQTGKSQTFGIVMPDGYATATIHMPASNLVVGSLQAFLDDWLKQGGAEKIDYVHGEDALYHLSQQQGNCGFYLPAMDKNELFRTVILDGVLPRKTFSMGEAIEKRFYMEARKII
ncbi:hypothetical protein BECAL_01660 [Bellilinea caldifistulae]|uniref:DUF1015 domain-containing protein n=1 Tax=Bellilinea caldifistulae TaxID=360411 RepID=A0A0P6Y079_9CHLR|nr:DUF1015 domain-containing protein [Bellilinea caldifistulae]KPL74873.1 hypothetical protein AC812_10095 [Bellilinea caldifistulae]GAP10490.1 hypothetical protein BECAL_01660 [Bellilinea caldifistulae]